MPEYAIRVGTNNSGFDYEKEVAALLAIRYALEDSVQDFWIAVNSNSVGDTDDVVLCVTPTKGERLAFLIQLKHEEPTGNVKYFEESHFTYVINDGKKRNQDKEKFSVDKYSRGYNKFKSNLSNIAEEQPEIIQNLRRVKQFSFILYTNKGLAKNLSCLVKCRNEDLNLNFLNTSTSSADIYKFRSDNFKSLNSFDEDFIQNLYLFPHQINIKGVNILIKSEIKKKFGSHVDLKSVTDKYLEIVKLWTKGCEFQNGIKYNTLHKKDIINILSDILLDKYKFNMEKCKFTCYDCPRCIDCPQKKIWNKLMVGKDVSIVRGDRLTRRFLRDYIGSEIKLKIKKQGEYWNTELDKLASNAFLDEIPNDRIQMIKLCSRNDNNSITLAGAYKFMWFYEELPLLLVISNQKEYNNIVQILKMSNYKLKVIVIVSNEANLTYQKKKPFSSLNDLAPDEKDEILKLTIQFQGRCSVLLSDITKDSMHSSLKCGDIIQILCDDFNVGNKFNFNYDKEGYIERSISKILISFDALVEIQNEVFLIETKNEEEKEIMVQKLASFYKNESEICDSVSKSEVYKHIMITDADGIAQKMIELETRHKRFHRLLFYEDFLEWRDSTESVRNISKFQEVSQEYPNEFLYDDVFGFFNNLDINKLQIISACSGMGKSALLNYISYYSTFHVWILPVTLNDLIKNSNLKEKFMQFKETEFFEFYANQILSADSTVQNLPFSRMVFEDMIKAKKILILLDGFDEISISHKNTFSSLLKFFQTGKYSTVITTREHMKSFLETEFNILSRNLKPFTLEEQEHFLTHYFKSKLCNENVSIQNPDLYAILLDFVEKLLNASRRNLGDRDEHLTEIPLHLELLANYFFEDCQSSLNREVVSLSTNFNLLDLIEKFIQDKNHILCMKYGENEETWVESLEDDQYLFALEYLFEKEYLRELNIGNSLKKYYEVKKSSVQFIQREGVLIARPMQDKMYIEFIHRLFAEYLAARWLTENIENPELKSTITALLQLRFEKAEHFQHLFGMFDRILTKHCIFHSSIINVKPNDLKVQLVSNPGVWFETDKINRTALHLLSIYAKNYTMIDLTSVLEATSLKNLELNCLDDFGYSIQDYAVLSGSWNLVTILCKLCPNFIRTGYNNGLEKYCIQKSLLGLMEFRNRWFALKLLDGIEEQFSINGREIRPVALIIRVLSRFLRKSSIDGLQDHYFNTRDLIISTISRSLRKPSNSACRDLENLSAEDLVLVEMEYPFNREQSEYDDFRPFDALLEAESALSTAKASGSNAFLEVYSGDIHSENLYRLRALNDDVTSNSTPKKSFKLVHAQWSLLRRTTSTLKENLEINFYINNYYTL